MLSFRIERLKYHNNFQVAPGETIEQEFVFINDGNLKWPYDTYFIFAGRENKLSVPEEIYIGEVDSFESIGIQISIKVPEDAAEDRYSIEYEFRHQLQTQSFGGSSVKFTLLIAKDVQRSE